MNELALFLSAFLAATILPFSSEVAFIAALANDMNPLSAIFFASCGNILAITLNYWFGYWLYDKTKTKLERSKTGTKSLKYGHKYGYYILLFSWLPIIGDPLTLVAGVLRLKFVWFVIVAGGLRVTRYYLLTLVV
ncbi:MAG: DedA family protein [Sulfurimonas sp.]|uniref:YqaA family protein n=1 Tax=Sulfurimonas sp. TaxID=2022749 RepID=UPI0025F0A6C3|nr:YqaA family protein [Sulfurimonas sp.]MCK9491584.1 DedA family protein [Sulfurimonas sp.]